MRALIVPRLRALWPEARIIHELPLRYSSRRIDLAAVTPEKIVAVEIKSSKDVCDRLEAQLRGFVPVCNRIVVALAPKWNEKLPDLVQERRHGVRSFVPQRTEAQAVIHAVSESSPASIETWTVDAAGACIDVTESAFRFSVPWTYWLLDLLHVAELQTVAVAHRLGCSARETHFALKERCHALLSGREVQLAVCKALRGRQAFGADSDPACSEEIAA